METTEKQVVDNFTMFKQTVGMLAGSQGFYSRLNAQLNEMSEEELEQAKEQINNCGETFHDTVDVVMWLESA